jgi:hypothetical protein
VLSSGPMPRVKLAVGGWFGASCAIAAVLWACSGKDEDLFSNSSRGGQTSTGGSGTAGDGISGATSGNGGTPSGGSGGSSNGGDATGGTSQTGGTAGEGGAAAESGTDSGGTSTGGTGLTSGAGGAGTSGSGGASAAGGVGMGGAGTAGAGNGGTGGVPPRPCSDDDDCDDANNADYCMKTSCNAAMGTCVPLGPPCVGDNAVFEPVCGCDGITYWNTCTITHEGFNIASMGECTGNDRPTCTRDDGPDSCPDREHAHCYRPVEMCGDPSPDEGYCWVLPTECPDNEPQTERYCGGTGGQARCIGLCEVIDAENSFYRNSPTCD